MLEDLLIESLEDAILLTAKSISILGNVPKDLKNFYLDEDIEKINEINAKKQSDLDIFLQKVDRNSGPQISLGELLTSAKHLSRSINKIPTPQECREIYEMHQKAFEEGKINDLQKRIKNMGFADGIVDLTRIACSIPDPILIGTYSIAASLGIYSKFASNKLSEYLAPTSAAISFLTPMALIHSGYAGQDLSGFPKFWLSVSQQIISAPMLLGFTLSFNAKRTNKKKLKEIESAIPNHDKVMKHMLMIPEMTKALKYASNTIRSNTLSDNYFDKDLEDLEKIIKGYYTNEFDLEDVYDARLKYVPSKEKARNRIQKVPSPKKISMSREEYLNLKESGEFDSYRAHSTKFIDNFSGSTKIEKNKDLLGFTFVHERIGEIQGYPISRLEDLIQSKIRGNLESNGRKEIIRKSGNGAILIEQYQPEGPLYKMQPIGALRVLYSRNKDEIIVHDILSHQENFEKVVDFLKFKFCNNLCLI